MTLEPNPGLCRSMGARKVKKQLCLETAALKGCRLQKEKEGYTVCGERGKMSLTFAPFDEETARAFQQADALVLDLTSRVSACEAGRRSGPCFG